MTYQQPAQPQPPQMPMQYLPKPKKHHAWGVIIPLWIIASPIALFLAYFLIRVVFEFFRVLIFGN